MVEVRERGIWILGVASFFSQCWTEIVGFNLVSVICGFRGVWHKLSFVGYWLLTNVTSPYHVGSKFKFLVCSSNMRYLVRGSFEVPDHLVNEMVLLFLIVSDLFLDLGVLDIGFMLMFFIWIQSPFLKIIKEPDFPPFFQRDFALLLFLPIL